MATQFRQLGPGDADLLVGFLLEWHRGDGLPLDPAMARAEVRRLLADNLRWHGWLIQQAGRRVGYLILNFREGGLLEPHRAYVSALYLMPECRTPDLVQAARRFVADLARWLHVRVLDCTTEPADRDAPILARTAPSLGWLDPYTEQATA